MAGGYRSSNLARRLLAGLVGAGLAGASLAIAPTAAAESDNGLFEKSHSRFVLDAQATTVKATVKLTLRNDLPDRRVGDGIQYYYFYAYQIPVPAGAEDVRATSNGSALRVSLKKSDLPSVKLATVRFPELRYRRTRAIELTYTIPGEPVRSKDFTRVGKGYATFAVEGIGDPGQVTVEVVLPASMTFDSTLETLELTSRTKGSTTTYSATENNVDTGIFAVVSARDPKQADERRVTVGETTLALLSFPGDQEWADFVADQLATGLPVAEDLVGQPWPGGLERIREDVSPEVIGYAWFDSVADEIVVGESLDQVLLFHELGHAWLNPEHMQGRWLYEGLTEVLARRVVDRIGEAGKPGSPRRPGSRKLIPLIDWGTQHMGGDQKLEEYGYAASYTAVQRLLGDLDDTTFAAVLSAAYTGEGAYETPGAVAWNRGHTDWRRFLDLVEVRGGGTDAGKVYRDLVLDSDRHSLLDDRVTARETYAGIDAADADWQPPVGLRTAMTNWEFDRAADVVAAIGPAPQHAAALQAAAADTSLAVPAEIREVYEEADEEPEYAELATLLPRTTAVMGQVADASNAATAGQNPVWELGALLLGVDQTAAAAREQFAAAELDAAATLSDEVATRSGQAVWVGSGVIVGGLVVLGGIALGGRGLSRALRKRAERRSWAPPSAGEAPFGTPPEQAGAPGEPSTEGEVAAPPEATERQPPEG